MSRRVVMVVYDGFQLLELSGPADVFSAVNDLTVGHTYTVEVVAPRAGPVTAGNGITLVTDRALSEVEGHIDTLLVVGGWPDSGDHLNDPDLVGGVARLAGRARRIASICSAAFVLADAGLLEGRRAATHWMVADELAARHPGVDVDADAIYIEDGAIWTSAGASACIDLALAMVAADHGQEVARTVASALVVYLQRPGGQSQFSLPTRTRLPERERLRELQAHIDAHPADDLSVPALAARASMSPRHFSRVFALQTGMTPGKYVERSRAEAARRLLETTDEAQTSIAQVCGLGSPETLYRVFHRHWRISPGDYRRHFRVPHVRT
ncbi:GlxA family transcriptional regulator [Pseudonocardia sp. GCM10023141]|uniref:GlxA family transcriptional regulator n=1 Tax=Pseudonocardia sp. GCM10023141 TaxID=3252653 RepID=UPI00361BB2F9